MGDERSSTDLAEALLASPLGCSFLNEATLSGFSADDIADPLTVMFVSGRAWGMISPWSSSQGRDIDALLRGASRWTELADAVVADERNAWWFADLDRSAQLRIDEPEVALGWVVPERWTSQRRAAHERYAQRPVVELVTSTAFGVLSSHLVAASEVVEDLGPLTFPVARSLVTVAPRARVFEVHGPED